METSLTLMITGSFEQFEQIKDYLFESARQLSNGESVSGFRRKGTKNENVYYNESVGAVVKRPNLILEPNTPDCVRVPTMELDNGWVAQPIVLKTERKRACELIKEKLKPYFDAGMFPDVHVFNVGWYDGRPVLFDW